MVEHTRMCEHHTRTRPSEPRALAFEQRRSIARRSQTVSANERHELPAPRHEMAYHTRCHGTLNRSPNNERHDPSTLGSRRRTTTATLRHE